jgi:hypothetical protein
MRNVLVTSTECPNREFTLTQSCQGVLILFVQTSNIIVTRPLEKCGLADVIYTHVSVMRCIDGTIMDDKEGCIMFVGQTVQDLMKLMFQHHQLWPITTQYVSLKKS